MDQSSLTGRLARATGALAAAAALALGLATPAPARAAEYKIYPTPQEIEYADGSVTLGDTATVVADGDIDADTRARLDATLELKGIAAADAEAPATTGALNVLVGVKASDNQAASAAESFLRDEGLLPADDFFGQTDAHMVAVVAAKGDAPATIAVLGRDTDAAYYGLSTLYQVFQQLPGRELSCLTVRDHADVITRGFIEGYYGNPWSTQDRVNLMTWGGYYKLNAYVYAPKDDPKHNKNWRELYTEDELVEKIEPLAAAGNASKCRFVYALHPFMSNPITTGNYDDSVAILKAKFKQVIDHGVRQIAILADDAGNQGNALYTRLCEDMTAWIHELQDQKDDDGSAIYAGLKDTIIFCPVNYMGNGESWYADLPSNIQVVNTGGRVWGQVSRSFVDSFKRNSSVEPFMWINWPCTDNDKDALSMGGYKNALGADCEPGSVKGVVLNPMQQSEPSKAGIFMNADFSWNMWTSYDHADRTWQDAFSYVDHGSPVTTDASDALKALSANMRQYLGGGVTFTSEESELTVDGLPPADGERTVAQVVDGFAAKVHAGTAAAEDIAQVRDVFAKLGQYAETYAAAPGNADMYEQISFFIDAWKDMCSAAVSYLDAYTASLDGDSATLVSRYFDGQASYASMDRHGFNYIDHTEYATVGNRYLRPIVKALNERVAELAKDATDPNPVEKPVPATGTLSLEKQVIASGKLEAASDGDDATFAWFKYKSAQQGDPDYEIRDTTQEGASLILTFDKVSEVNRVHFVQDSGDRIERGKLQYRASAGGEWADLADIDGATVQELSFDTVKAAAIRVVNTQTTAKWWKVFEFSARKGTDEPESVATATFENVSQYQTYGPARAVDGDDSTQAWTNANIEAGHALRIDYEPAKTIGYVKLVQGTGDKLAAGVLEYTEDGSTWVELAQVGADATQEFHFANVQAKAIRVRSTKAANAWWQVFEVVTSSGKDGAKAGAIVSDAEGVELTGAAADGAASIHDGTAKLAAGQYVAIDLGAIRDRVQIDTGKTEMPRGAKVVTSVNGLEWVAADAGAQGIQARYVGVKLGDTAGTVTFKDFSIAYARAAEISLAAERTTLGAVAGTMDIAKMFDGDLSTAAKNGASPRRGDTLTFDLGQVRTIHSIAYYVVESSLDPIRNGVFEVSEDGEEWTPVLHVNDETPVSEDGWETATAKDCAWLTHDGENPGYMYTANPKTAATEGNEADPNGTEDLNVRGRYLRLRMTAGFSKRWVEVSEIVINGGEYVSPYADADVVSSSIELKGHAPSKMFDDDLSSTWIPSGKAPDGSEDTVRSMTYTVSDPLGADGEPVKGIRFIASGAASAAEVTAELYTDDTYTSTERYSLGTLSGSVNDFGFGGKVVKSVTVSWDDVAPQISEIYLVDASSPVEVPDPTPAPEPEPVAKHVVTYLVDGAEVSKVEVEDGKTAPVPDPPQKEGHTFLHWYTDDAGQAYDFDTPVTGDLVLNAAFKKDGEVEPDPKPTIHTVTFQTRVPDAEPITVEVEDGKTVVAPADPELAGWKFKGWFLDTEFTRAFDFSTPVTEDLTLWADWSRVDEDGGVPTDPEEPTTPVKPFKPSGQMPHTGDDSMFYVAGIGIVAVIAIAVGVALSRKGGKR